MNLLVFAHTPPPHHGQSWMVQVMLDALRETPAGEPPIHCHHINARFSRSIEDIGQARAGKLAQAVRHAARAVRLRFREAAPHFYYVPADTNRSALFRDWVVLGLCRPFFRTLTLHWHAVGLGERVAGLSAWQRMLTQRTLGAPDLSLVLAEYNRRDADYFRSRRTVVVPNGIPDPCPDFAQTVLPRRLARTAGQKDSFNLFYVGLCHRDKGIFDLMDALALANQRLSSGPRLRLILAGALHNDEDRQRLEARRTAPDLWRDGQPLVEYRGFVSGHEKRRLFEEADCFCFPTRYGAESFGLVLLEAMAFGLPVVTTRWRMIPELLPPDYPGLAEPGDPASLAERLIAAVHAPADVSLRAWFEARFTVTHFAANLRRALWTLES